jgi:hypothetical protein
LLLPELQFIIIIIIIIAYLLKAGTVKPTEIAFAKERHCKRPAIKHELRNTQQ